MEEIKVVMYEFPHQGRQYVVTAVPLPKFARIHFISTRTLNTGCCKQLRFISIVKVALMEENAAHEAGDSWCKPIMENKMETTIEYWGYIRIMENKMETTIEYWGYIRIMENKMETTIEYWGYIRIMEKKMETTIEYWGYIRIMEKKMETTVLLNYSGQFPSPEKEPPTLTISLQLCHQKYATVSAMGPWPSTTYNMGCWKGTLYPLSLHFILHFLFHLILLYGDNIA